VCRYLILGPDEHVLDEITPRRLRPSGREPAQGDSILKEVTRRTLSGIEKEMITRALAHNKGNLKHAARTLGISYRTLMNKMDQAGLPRVRHASRPRDNQ
jgi:two-component system, NtrC family, response regulator AtoC